MIKFLKAWLKVIVFTIFYTILSVTAMVGFVVSGLELADRYGSGVWIAIGVVTFLFVTALIAWDSEKGK